MQNFGIAWIAFAIAVAIHVADEAAHDFLSVYNPIARKIRSRLPFLPIPTFSFAVWLGGLAIGVTLLLALSPYALSGDAWLRLVAVPLAILVGIGNGLLHLIGSAWYRRWMPGVYSAPLLVIAGLNLLAAAAD